MIACASRRLTDVEKRYSQVEKEALAVVWACEKLHFYLFGREFVLITDNRAVELIFGNPKREQPLRIKRWVLRLAGYRLRVVHKPSAQNVADYLSRQPTGEPDSKITDETEEIVSLISEHSFSKSIRRHKIVSLTATD